MPTPLDAGAGPDLTRPSLTRRLLAFALGALLAVWFGLIAAGWRAGVHEADEVTDGHLASVAALALSLPDPAGIDTVVKQAAGPGWTMPPPDHADTHEYQSDLALALWDAQGRLLARAGAAPLPAADMPDGFHEVTLGDPPQRWRSVTLRDTARGRKVMVMVSVAERDRLARDIAGQIVEPGLWLLPVVTLVLGVALRRGLVPLYRLSHEVAQLDARRYQPLPERGRLHEFQAVVTSINGLLARQQRALARERQLASEVAHELRTPLASISLQARALRDGLDTAAAERALQQIETDALRAGHVLSQLLALARTDARSLADQASRLDLRELAQRVTAEFAQAAWRSGHTLEVEEGAPMLLYGHAGLLEIALRNLLDNVLRHTPRGTHALVRVTTQDAMLCLSVLDDGARADSASADSARADSVRAVPTGASPADGGADSLGLGHGIVARVAEVHGGRFGPCPTLTPNSTPAASSQAAPFTTGYALWLPVGSGPFVG